MRVGIPPHRLNYEMMDWEIQQIRDEGVEIHLNTYVHDIPGLLSKKSDKFDGPLRCRADRHWHARGT